jgi:hypothetical protein
MSEPQPPPDLRKGVQGGEIDTPKPEPATPEPTREGGMIGEG